MGQQRLNMFARKKSIVDEEYEKELASILSEIREQAREISEKVAKIYKNRSEPEPTIFDEGEVVIDDKRVNEIIKPMKDHLKLLKKKYQNKKALQPKVQREASSQSDIFDL